MRGVTVFFAAAGFGAILIIFVTFAKKKKKKKKEKTKNETKKNEKKKPKIASRLVHSVVRPRRSVLYVPLAPFKGSMVTKAAGMADVVVLDMEDGVHASAKTAARGAVGAALAEARRAPAGGCEVAVRINPVGSGSEEEDLRAALLSGEQHAPDAIVLPKCDHLDHLRWLESSVVKHLSSRPGPPPRPVTLWGMVESATAVTSLGSIVSQAPEPFSAFIFGGDDYAASVGATRTEGNEELRYARGAFLAHCKARGVSAIDIVCIDVSDAGLARLAREASEAGRDGWDGKQLIHPKQVEPTHAAFSPPDRAVAEARGILDAFDKQGGAGRGAFVYEGRMIDMPTVKQMRAIVAKAK